MTFPTDTALSMRIYGAKSVAKPTLLADDAASQLALVEGAAGSLQATLELTSWLPVRPVR